MRVIAKELGYDGSALRQAGEEFEMPDTVFDAGGLHFFEPVDPAVKAKVEAEQAARAKAALIVPAIDPAKQAAEHEASVKALTEKHASDIAALNAEIDALKKGGGKTK